MRLPALGADVPCTTRFDHGTSRGPPWSRAHSRARAVEVRGRVGQGAAERERHHSEKISRRAPVGRTPSLRTSRDVGSCSFWPFTEQGDVAGLWVLIAAPPFGTYDPEMNLKRPDQNTAGERCCREEKNSCPHRANRLAWALRLPGALSTVPHPASCTTTSPPRGEVLGTA